jgi:hypothetical protein
MAAIQESISCVCLILGFHLSRVPAGTCRSLARAASSDLASYCANETLTSPPSDSPIKTRTASPYANVLRGMIPATRCDAKFADLFQCLAIGEPVLRTH